MATSYSAELSDWLANRDHAKRSKNRHLVSFLAVRGDVREALDKGYSRRSIWEHMSATGKLSYRYEAFLKHVRRHITDILPKQSTVNNPQPTQKAPETPTIQRLIDKENEKKKTRPRITNPGDLHRSMTERKIELYDPNAPPPSQHPDPKDLF